MRVESLAALASGELRVASESNSSHFSPLATLNSPLTTMNISAVMSQLMAFHELYGDLPVLMLSNGVYAPLPNLPWLAYPIGQPPGPANYSVVFGPAAQAT